ncbi:MAG: NfeD family protein [Oscillospiraceae bacterium]
MDWIFWVIALVVFVIAEVATMQLVSIWFAAGSFASLICAAFGAPVWVQFVVFLAVSAVLVICTRPFVKKFQKNIVPTNAELDVGKTCIVTEAIDNSTNSGRVNLNGVFWAARSESGDTIPEGTTVTVKKIDGTKLIVS